MSDAPRVTIAVNSYRNTQMLRLCLQSVYAAIDAAGTLSCEVIVADCATQDDTRDLMRHEFSAATFLPDERNIGFGAMVNKCLDRARGHYIFLINADTIMTEQTLVQMVAYFDAHPQIGILAPAQYGFNLAPLVTCFRFYRPMTILYRRTPLGRTPWGRRHLAHFEMRDYDRRAPRAVDWVMGSAMMVRADRVAKVGGMDPRFFMYMEDVDWCRRFWSHGYPVVYNPSITMYHYYGKGSAGRSVFHALFANRLTWIHIISALKYFWKYAFVKVPQHSETV